MYIIGSFLSVFEARRGDEKILSPKKTKNIEFHSRNNETQIMCNFHKIFRIGGSHVALINADKSTITAYWIDDHSVEIKYPNQAEVKFHAHANISNQENSIYFFGDTVIVSFVPE